MIKQITVFLENTEGRLAALTHTLRRANVNMYALTIAETSDYGLVRIICDDPDAALEALRAEDFRATQTNVSAIEVPNRPGGLAELLDTLASSGYTLCVATSKPRVFAERILDHFGIAPYFSFVGGTGLDGSLPTKADVIAHVLAGSNITDRGTALMIGDRKYDILGAKTVGIDSAGVLYGYGDRAELEAAGADYILPAIPDLEELLLE